MAHHFTQTCAYFTAARYMRTVEQLADRVFAPTGMKPAYAYIMMALEDTHPLTVSELARSLGYERSTVSRMVRTLAETNLVQLSSAGRATAVELGPAADDFLVIANRCLDKFGALTDCVLGNDKAQMTQLLTSNNDRLRGELA
ncbi:MarR family winged helix-turn-helix transcriptional regulator [Lacticaseibacillus songhuajiangensis]|jgi:DNA-binding MarR family transcriptional regulator|uniref:MarR family winged helix-turn-helix transcriptional regulator n=1 Tax=Lacticaseibacillus songhuajiangensis TaxID=1296539 RepID=UPI000F796806|nr:helix-turn-helix domain-containing protein [Lacticaseibacillus songhuajiangensis]